MLDEYDRSEGTRPIPDEAKEVGQSVVKLGSTNDRERDDPIKNVSVPLSRTPSE